MPSPLDAIFDDVLARNEQVAHQPLPLDGVKKAPDKAPEPDKPVEPEIKAEPAKVEPKPSPLAEQIRKDREQRQQRQAQQADQNNWKAKHDELAAQIDAMRSNEDPFKDPVGWAKARKMTKEEQAQFAETLLYDIVPDKAPTDLRLKLWEANQARKDRMAKEQAEQQAQAQAAQANQQALQRYAQELEQSVASFNEGSYPESEAWFGDNPGGYMESLLATAKNMAQSGQQDLHPATVAKVLETEVAKRMAARDSRRNRGPTPQAKPETAKAVEPAAQVASTSGMTGSGTPRRPAVDENERMQRAMEVLFGIK